MSYPREPRHRASLKSQRALAAVGGALLLLAAARVCEAGESVLVLPQHSDRKTLLNPAASMEPKAERKADEYLPIVLWHGLGDSCCNPDSIGAVQAAIEEHLPGVFVYSIDTGKDGSASSDSWSSFFGLVMDQVDKVCEDLKAVPQLADGYNAIGFSQGGLFFRAVAQRCDSGPRMATLVTMGSPHQGVSAAPGCEDSADCATTQSLINFGAYIGWIQSSVIPAQYYKDPAQLDKYMEASLYLADINNERKDKAESYAVNLKKLQRLVLVRFTDDQTVVPRDSAWFSWWDEEGETVVSMEETQLYKDDLIGLGSLDKAGKVKKVDCPGEHMHFSIEWLLSNIIDPYMA